MRKWREENSRNSEQIVEVGEELINEYASRLGDDSKFLNLLYLSLAHVHLPFFVFLKNIFYVFSPVHVNLSVMYHFLKNFSGSVRILYFEKDL